MSELNIKKISEIVKDEIEKISVELYEDTFRWHLGASVIGHECKRYLWLSYRWCFKESFDGRMYRLFNRGHREEERLITYLKELGFTVYETNPDTGKQFTINQCGGHFGGSMDGIAYFPERYNIKEPVLLEFKTMAAGTPFNSLSLKGMRISKPVHFAQTCSYGTDGEYNFKYVLYIGVCKNNDDIYVELAELDKNTGDRMRLKAHNIITSQTMPERLSDNPTFFKCVNCAAKDICHNGAIPLKNCRSCVNAVAAPNGEFHCNHFNGIIPREYVANPVNCGDIYKAITDNV